jgi:hypothetical protein
MTNPGSVCGIESVIFQYREKLGLLKGKRLCYCRFSPRIIHPPGSCQGCAARYRSPVLAFEVAKMHFISSLRAGRVFRNVDHFEEYRTLDQAGAVPE